jgi:hypothetical protein
MSQQETFIAHLIELRDRLSNNKTEVSRMNTKSNLLFAVSISFLLITQTAHADFRKALEAYQNRDGQTMLAEVKDAVEKKNDDGLMLFLNAMNLDAATSDYDNVAKESKSTLRKILTQPQWDEMRELLVQATNNSIVDAQYFLLTRSVFRTDLYRKYLSQKQNQTASSAEVNNLANTTRKLTNEEYSEAERKITAEYIERGSRLAMRQSTLANRAEAGDPFSQLSLGLMYLNYGRDFDYGAHFGCGYLSKEPLCQTKDEVKGYYWLKRAARSYETSGHEDFDLFPSQMCEFLHNTANGDQAKLKQAYLWALKGTNEVANISQSRTCMKHMYESGAIKIAAPEVYSAWGGDWKAYKALVYKSELKELPDWIIEIRKELVKENLPVFTYHLGSELEVYADGRVLFGSVADPYKDLLMKVPPKTVKTFLAELGKTGFYQWTTADSTAGICPDFGPCVTIDMYITAREGDKVRRIFFSLLPQYINSKDSTNRKRMAIIKALVDKYFPTQSLRCSLGNSGQRKQACLQRDTQWEEIAKEGK